MFKRIVGMLIILMLVGAAVMAQENITKTPPPPKKLEIPPGMEEEWGAFKERYGDAFTLVKWGSTCGCMRELYGYYDTKRGELKSEEEAEGLAREFLKENAGIFKIDISALEVKRLRQNKKFGYWNVEYVQTYNGVPVYRSEVGLTLSNNSIIKSLSNNFYPNINISTEPKLTKEGAVDVVLKQKDPGTTVNETGEVINGTLLYIVPKTEDGNITYHLTWRVPTHTALYFINAKDGSIVLRVQTAFPTGEDMVSETTRNSGGIGSVNYSIFALALLKKFWTPIVLLILIFFVVWRRKR